MDVRIRQIVPKAPGTYFIVTDNSQIQEIEEESRLRIFFINSVAIIFNFICITIINIIFWFSYNHCIFYFSKN